MTIRVAVMGLVILILVCPVVMGAGFADSDWPCYKGNARRTGLSSHDFGDNLGRENWVRNVGGSVYTTPVIGPDGTIYVMSSYSMQAFDAQGNQLWAKPWMSGDSGSPVITDNGDIIFMRYDYTMTCIDTEGNFQWAFNLTGKTYSSSLIGNDGTIYFGSRDYKVWDVERTSYEWTSSLYALNSDGTMKWNKTFVRTISSSPAMGQGNTIYITHDRNLTALNQNGNVLWEANMGYYVGASTPAVAPDGTI
ncbi:MAG TPA: hypothetical protein ENN76_01490, partial [Euryarchaeota archaeon]|nr:hypothetical protein [Euryarchaeota archaeon]